MEPLDETRRDDPDHALVPVLAPEHVRTAAAQSVGPLGDLAQRRPEDRVLDRLTIAVQRLELAREPSCLAPVVGEQQLERHAGMA